MKIKCLECGIVLKAQPFKECGCDNHTFIDGVRWGGVNPDKVAILSIDWLVEADSFMSAGYKMDTTDIKTWWVKCSTED